MPRMNPTCTAEDCGSEVVQLIPAAGTFGVTEKCPGCLRNIPLMEGEPSEHARHEVHVPLPKLKRAVFSALRDRWSEAEIQGLDDCRKLLEDYYERKRETEGTRS